MPDPLDALFAQTHGRPQANPLDALFSQTHGQPDVRAQIAARNASAAPPPEEEGPIRRFLQGAGLPTSKDEFVGLMKTLATPGGPGPAMAGGVINMLTREAGAEAGTAQADMAQGNYGGAAGHALAAAVPFLGHPLAEGNIAGAAGRAASIAAPELLRTPAPRSSLPEALDASAAADGALPTSAVYAPREIPASLPARIAEYAAREGLSKVPLVGTKLGDLIRGQIAKPRTQLVEVGRSVDTSPSPGYTGTDWPMESNTPPIGGEASTPPRLPRDRGEPSLPLRPAGDWSRKPVDAAYGDAPVQPLIQPKVIGPDYDPKVPGEIISRDSIPLAERKPLPPGVDPPMSRLVPEEYRGKIAPDVYHELSGRSHVFGELQASPERWEVLSRLDSGTRILTTGQEAMVLTTPSGEVVRVAKQSPGAGASIDRPNIPEVLQPARTEQIGSWRMEWMPKVKTFNPNLKEATVGAEGISDLKSRLAARGYDFWDTHSGNVGVTESGHLVVIDPGAIRHTGTLTESLGAQAASRGAAATQDVTVARAAEAAGITPGTVAKSIASNGMWNVTSPAVKASLNKAISARDLSTALGIYLRVVGGKSLQNDEYGHDQAVWDVVNSAYTEANGDPQIARQILATKEPLYVTPAGEEIRPPYHIIQAFRNQIGGDVPNNAAGMAARDAKGGQAPTGRQAGVQGQVMQHDWMGHPVPSGTGME